MVPVVQVLEMGMQCLRGHHIEVKRELTGKPPPNVDGHRWRAAREKVSFVFAGLEKSFYSLKFVFYRIKESEWFFDSNCNLILIFVTN